LGDPAIPPNKRLFFANIFALDRFSGNMETIGANRPRLHGFHRFLPHLWELFYWFRCTASVSPAAVPEIAQIQPLAILANSSPDRN
jgi:hypothetical protein